MNDFLHVPQLEMGRVITWEKSKEELQKAFEALGSNEVATASKIENYYMVKLAQRVVDNKKQRCWIVLE